MGGDFTTRAMYEKIIDNTDSYNFTGLLENKLIPPKVVFMTWASLHKSLPTRFMLSRRGVYIQSTTCVLCNEEDEDLNHLFIHCRWEKQYGIYYFLHYWWIMPEVFKALQDSWKLFKVSKRKAIVWKITSYAIFWEI